MSLAFLVIERMHLAIIGGGIAGLYAAEYLLMRGHRVHLFEQEDHLGGRIRTVQAFDRALECGAMWIRREDARLLRLVRRLGVPLVEQTWTQRFHEPASQDRYQQSMMRLTGSAPDSRTFRQWSTDSCPDADWFLRHAPWQDGHDASARSVVGCFPLRALSMPYIWRVYVVPGGLSRLVEALAERVRRLGGVISTSSRVTELHSNGRNCTLTVNGTTHDFAAVVLASPNVDMLRADRFTRLRDSLRYLRVACPIRKVWVHCPGHGLPVHQVIVPDEPELPIGRVLVWDEDVLIASFVDGEQIDRQGDDAQRVLSAVRSALGLPLHVDQPPLVCDNERAVHHPAAFDVRQLALLGDEVRLPRRANLDHQPDPASTEILVRVIAHFWRRHGILLVGEAVARCNHGWMEGALQSVEEAISMTREYV